MVALAHRPLPWAINYYSYSLFRAQLPVLRGRHGRVPVLLQERLRDPLPDPLRDLLLDPLPDRLLDLSSSIHSMFVFFIRIM